MALTYRQLWTLRRKFGASPSETHTCCAGSAAVLSLPRGSTAYPVGSYDRAASLPMIERRAAPRREQPFVLIVDDHQDSCELFGIFLETMGFETRGTTDAQRALDLAIAQPPDAILTDLAMPRVDGWTLVRQLKAHERTKDIPIVVMSGHADASTLERAQGEGCSAFFTKPCDPAAIAETIRALIFRRSPPAPTRESQ